MYLAIEPPAVVAVADEPQLAAGRPAWLINRLRFAAGHAARLRQGAPGVHVGHPELGAVPRHLGVAPADPRQRRTIRAEARRRVEIVALGQHVPGAAAAVERYGHEGVHALATLGGVIFAHADQPV